MAHNICPGSEGQKCVNPAVAVFIAGLFMIRFCKSLWLFSGFPLRFSSSMNDGGKSKATPETQRRVTSLVAFRCHGEDVYCHDFYQSTLCNRMAVSKTRSSITGHVYIATCLVAMAAMTSCSIVHCNATLNKVESITRQCKSPRQRPCQ